MTTVAEWDAAKAAMDTQDAAFRAKLVDYWAGNPPTVPRGMCEVIASAIQAHSDALTILNEAWDAAGCV